MRIDTNLQERLDTCRRKVDESKAANEQVYEPENEMVDIAAELCRGAYTRLCSRFSM